LVGGVTTRAAVIGSPVGHSLSPAIHNAAFAASGLDWRYEAIEVEPDGVAAVLDEMRGGGFGGLSVTTPHKDAVAAAADERSADVEALAAANCLVPLGDGRVRAENTDGDGFVRSLVEAGVDPAGRRVCVLGAGGAARAVILALGRVGAAEVAVLNRTRANAERAAALAGVAGRVAAGPVAADILVNATTVGMGEGGGLPLDPSHLRAGQVVVDLVYHPLETPLLIAARAAGCTALDGLGMLVGQAAIAFELWTGTPAPVAEMARAARAARTGRTGR
jgi:shikimate dehydrogenase